MHRRAGAWPDVIRVAKAHGGAAAAKQVAYAWAVHMQSEEALTPAACVSALRKAGLVDSAVEYAAETTDFDRAFALVNANAQGGSSALDAQKLADVHLKHAMHLEVRLLAAGTA